MSKYKQVIVIRKDIKEMSCGKACAQAAHAAQLALFEAKKWPYRTPNIRVDEWVKNGYHKIILGVDSEAHLKVILESAVNAGLPAAMVTDFGLTEIPPNTPTAVGIGPEESDKIDRVTGHLKLY